MSLSSLCHLLSIAGQPREPQERRGLAVLRTPTFYSTCKTTKRSPSTSNLTGVPRRVHVWKSWGSCFRGVVAAWNRGVRAPGSSSSLSQSELSCSLALFQWQSPLDSLSGSRGEIQGWTHVPMLPSSTGDEMRTSEHNSTSWALGELALHVGRPWRGPWPTTLPIFLSLATGTFDT